MGIFSDSKEVKSIVFADGNGTKEIVKGIYGTENGGKVFFEKLSIRPKIYVVNNRLSAIGAPKGLFDHNKLFSGGKGDNTGGCWVYNNAPWDQKLAIQVTPPNNSDPYPTSGSGIIFPQIIESKGYSRITMDFKLTDFNFKYNRLGNNTFHIMIVDNIIRPTIKYYQYSIKLSAEIDQQFFPENEIHTIVVDQKIKNNGYIYLGFQMAKGSGNLLCPSRFYFSIINLFIE